MNTRRARAVELFSLCNQTLCSVGHLRYTRETQGGLVSLIKKIGIGILGLIVLLAIGSVIYSRFRG